MEQLLSVSSILLRSAFPALSLRFGSLTILSLVEGSKGTFCFFQPAMAEKKRAAIETNSSSRKKHA